MDSIAVTWNNLWVFVVLSWMVSWFIGYTMSALWHKHVKILATKIITKRVKHASAHPK